MKATYTVICCIVVGIIAWLLARSRAAAQPKTQSIPAPASCSTPAPVPVTTVEVTPVTPPPPMVPAPVVLPVTNRLTLGADGQAYNVSLPAPYNALPAMSPFGGGVPSTTVTTYYIWVYRNRTTGVLDNHIYAGYLTPTTDTEMLAYINSVKPATRDIQFLINPSGAVILGGF